MAKVELTQYIRPDGRKNTVYADLPNEVAQKAQDMALSCEVLMSGQVVIYGRFKDEDEELEYMDFAENTAEASPNRPDAVLTKVIEKVWARR